MAKTPSKSAEAKQQAKDEALPAEPRKLKQSGYRSFRLHKRIKGEKLPSSFRLMRTALVTLAKHWKLFLGIVLLYGLLNAILVQGFNAVQGVGDAKDVLDELFTGNWGQLASGFTIFVYLLGSSGNTTNAAAGVYQFFLVLIVSLALIWTLRQVYAGNKVRIRDGFYRGMSPLVPFVLVLLATGVQLIPMAIGLTLYNVVTVNAIAVTGLEQMLWILLACMLSILSLYFISSSLFALYIVTLPDMTPVRALRSARQLVAHRRWAVMRKVFFLPVALVVLAGVIVIPLILLATPIVPWVFFALTMLLVPVGHGYLYALYRAML